MNHSSQWQHRDLSHFRRTTGDDIFDVHAHYAKWLEEARPGGYYLYYLSASSGPEAEISVPTPEVDEPLINLASYNYLGLSYRPEVIAGAEEMLRRFGLGAAGSPYLSGLFDIHEQLADELADFKGVESVLLFPTGYAANIGTIPALVGPGDTVITDLLAHASILDGCVLSRAKLAFFRHNDCASLERRLQDAEGRRLVIVEGVYSMDGDVAPLAEIAALCRRYDARLMVDEAHSAFVYGEHGRGLVEHFEVEDAVDIQLGTLSKSLGGMGGYVGGSRELIEYLRPYARSQVFSCALAPPIVGGLLAALDIVRREPQLRAKLWRNTELMRAALDRHGIDTGDSSSQVIPVMIGDDTRIFAITEELMAAGIYLNPIRYPAVKRNRSRFRISISSAHEPERLELAATRIAEVLRKHEVIP